MLLCEAMTEVGLPQMDAHMDASDMVAYVLVTALGSSCALERKAEHNPLDRCFNTSTGVQT